MERCDYCFRDADSKEAWISDAGESVRVSPVGVVVVRRDVIIYEMDIDVGEDGIGMANDWVVKADVRWISHIVM